MGWLLLAIGIWCLYQMDRHMTSIPSAKLRNLTDAELEAQDAAAMERVKHPEFLAEKQSALRDHEQYCAEWQRREALAKRH
jgi:hypothetical protein